jgi:transcriptional regulator with XRE-family HTH domain
MAGESGKKLFVGPRFRRIRQQQGLSQTQMAEGLGISPSYINLIERNQRPVTAQLLLRLAETYDLDLRDLATADEDRFFAELNEIFSDPLFRQIDLPKQELRDLAELCPGVIRYNGSTPPIPKPGAARPWWRHRWPTATRAAITRPIRSSACAT